MVPRIKSGIIMPACVKATCSRVAMHKRKSTGTHIGPPTDGSCIPLLEVGVEKQVSSLKGPDEQMAWALSHVRACTDELRSAFHERCFDIDKKTHLAATEKAFLRVWLLLRRLPRELVDEARPEELTHLRKRHSAIELHAIGICIGSTV